MSRTATAHKKKRDDAFRKRIAKAQAILADSLLSELGKLVTVSTNDLSALPDGWAQWQDAARWGGNRCATLILNGSQRASEKEWAFVLATAYLHVGLNHIRMDRTGPAWFAACGAQALNMALNLKLARPPEAFQHEPPPVSSHDLERLHEYFLETGDEAIAGIPLISGAQRAPWIITDPDANSFRTAEAERTRAFAAGLRAAVRDAVDVASNTMVSGRTARRDSAAVKAKQWFVSQFPLLGALAAAFDVIDDADICNAQKISVAAVNASTSEIYLNPNALLDGEQLKFVLAHEMLHVGLRHELRRQGRDPWLWNVACDYVINGWLVQMNIGELPSNGLLYDPELAGRSAEEIYDEIARNLRWRRKLLKLKTFKGVHACDILDDRRPAWWSSAHGLDLDSFYRRALLEGLELHQRGPGRGLLPSGLVEEVKSLNQPPIPWDVELAQWLDEYFPPVEQRRTYARPSRRQAASPHIPRPKWYLPEEITKARTFGVVLDTSGSMSRRGLGMGIGAVASYAMSREVLAVRLVFCDAAPTDAGYVQPEELLQRVRVTGRGGTVLQPGVNLLERDENFPKDGPILLITDGDCDHLTIARNHAFLLPKGGGRLPFKPKGPVFQMGD